MKDLSQPINASNKKIFYYFVLLSSVAPLLIYQQGITSLEIFLLPLIKVIAINFAFICTVFCTFRFFIKNKDISFVLTLSIILLFIHSNSTVSFFKEYFSEDLENAHAANLLFFVVSASFIFYLVKKSLVMRNFFGIASSSFLHVYIIFTLTIIGTQYSSLLKTGTQSYFENQFKSFDYKPVRQVSFEDLPDIYYVLADMYTSFDSLEKNMGFDNKDFYNDLKKRGFLVKKESYSNYALTHISLNALYNFNYIQDTLRDNQLKEQDLGKSAFEYLRMNNYVIKELVKHDYEIFETSGFAYPISKYGIEAVEDIKFLSTKTFKGFFRNNIAANYFNSLLYTIYGPYHKFSPFRMFRDGVLQTFESMNIVATKKTTKPKFVHSHLMVPHNPFMFYPDGSIIKPDSFSNTDCCFPLRKMVVDGKEVEARIDKSKYIQQIKFTNNKIIEFIDNVKANASRPYIIVIQGDHGSASQLDWSNPSDIGIKERMSILDAVFISDGKYESFEKSSSHVNVFRNIFNKYLGYDLPILDHKSYFCSYDGENFIDVTHLTRDDNIPSDSK